MLARPVHSFMFATIKSLSSQLPELDSLKQLRIYQNRSTYSILNQLMISQALKYNLIVDNIGTLNKGLRSVIGPKLTNRIFEFSIGDVFTCGRDSISVERKFQSASDLSFILDYSCEAIQGKENDKSFFDYNSKVFRSSILTCAKEPERQNMIATKLSGLAPKDLLIKFTEARLRQLKFFSKDQDLKQSIPIEEIFNKFEAESNMTLTPQEKKQFQDDILGGQTTVDYVTWRYKVHPSLLFNQFGSSHPIIKYFGQFSEEEMTQLQELANRLEYFCDPASKLSIRLAIDAEQTYLQEAIDSICEQLEAKYNKNEVIIMNTIQNYLKQSGFRMDYEIEKSKKFGLFIALKMVRGAYMVEESKLAQEKGYENPICNSVEETSDMYNNNCLKYFKNASLHSKLMIASHNATSCKLIADTINQYENGQWKDSVSFAQLYGLSDHLTAQLKTMGSRVYKYAPFGSTDILMPYLVRRAQEQKTMLAGIEIQRNLLWSELKKRFLF